MDALTTGFSASYGVSMGRGTSPYRTNASFCSTTGTDSSRTARASTTCKTRTLRSTCVQHDGYWHRNLHDGYQHHHIKKYDGVLLNDSPFLKGQHDGCPRQRLSSATGISSITVSSSRECSNALVTSRRGVTTSTSSRWAIRRAIAAQRWEPDRAPHHNSEIQGRTTRRQMPAVPAFGRRCDEQRLAQQHQQKGMSHTPAASVVWCRCRLGSLRTMMHSGLS